MSIHTCRCCMSRPPDKNLKTKYIRHGNDEIYSEMLKECFQIHMAISNSEDAGICEVCVTRLTEASDFKHQVQKCQKDFEELVAAVKDESQPIIKEEVADYEEGNGIYFLDLNEEDKDDMFDYAELGDSNKGNSKLAELLTLKTITVKRKDKKQKLHIVDTKHDLNEEDKDDMFDYAELGDSNKGNSKLAELLTLNTITVKRKDKKQKLHIVDTKHEKKLKNNTTKPLKISIRTLTKLDKIMQPVKTISMLRVTENLKHKTNIENLIKYSNCTPFLNKTLSGITCAYCKGCFNTPQDLRIHIDESHKNSDLIDHKKIDKNNLSYKIDVTDLKCNICQKNFDFIKNLKQHLVTEHDIKFYPDVNDYVLEFKLNSNEILNCALCNSTYETFKMLLQHMNGHYRNYICDVCDLGFINRHRLRNHQRTHEIGDFNCSFCDKVFTTKVRKVCHEKYTHNTNARYTTNCPQCDQSFNSYYQRNRHMYLEHNTTAASYKCNICDKSFILKSKLTSHIKKVHLMERNHICSVCGQGFFIKQSLDEHMIKHNGERVYKCAVCFKAYARKKTLREHMRIHNNDRRFKCGICGSAFVQKCSMKSHMLSNHGITLAEYELAQAEVKKREGISHCE